ncbi:bromodomain and WD repeat-containing protein 1 isoform X2 [Amborella trichopoda]|uniref:bromodomain and WD repeat-containing protein 1 isoform X2 n=1 Tax=Amborella trichopoda TaxID=13333 RepID=UPI0009C11306|nr:bromodomain and WD repeat-containing protein 1 isoform X2 [Amborella trichopoda]|eukprot:XP_020529700.1 bromodomain and WD repeat-containing protein 1 isoform X2 [Amborella trichopoda]
MACRKYDASAGAAPLNLTPSTLAGRTNETGYPSDPLAATSPPMEADVDIDLSEVYFLIMHFLSGGPCHRTYGQFWNELLEHQLLPRRYHAWYSRKGIHSGDEDDNGMSFPLSYNKLVERYPHIDKDHLVKLLKQLLLTSVPSPQGTLGGNAPRAGDVPTLLGTGSFSLLGSDRTREDQKPVRLPSYLRWPHIQAGQLHGLSLREIGGGFTKHHRAPSIRAACYAIVKPATMLQKMQIIKRLRGHQNAVYCAIFDRSGRYVITGSDDRLVKIWSMETAFCLASCRGHEWLIFFRKGDITDLAVSSNNAVVASASNDCIIRVWRLPDGVPISVLRGHTGAVTAIAFSPRPSAVYQLLSSSDDGTCRIWDARHSQSSPRIYIPKPPDPISANGGKNSEPSQAMSQRSHQILCCAYNANGTVFVTGSSDTYARVWSACKWNLEESEQPNHEMDVLSGHENDVNYVQFSGCAVASRSLSTDFMKEDNVPKFKNSWFTHDNIVTCSRDGSAIIWIPRSRKSHGKVGRWTRAYHLKVPPPPMPPQPPRGGPRQRLLPTPRGVNMIVWSLDNRFVLAAIMDCRICVWNAVDGSLVHSLTGHTESTYVLDVHPFNPRIAMSAGYDGKTIVWDIWEGIPIRIYETGRFKLVDGKFSPDGTSIILSDEIGQIYIIATGQGESQKDAKYDQFFLGDYRPLIQDAHGNVLDQETQLPPYRRNMQDLLCDISMIPYPDPYQSAYQQRRLGALGIEWRPPSVRLAVGPLDNGTQDYVMHLPQALIDGDWDRLLENPADFADVMDWEPEIDVQSDDNDSEYNVTDEYSSEGERGSFGTCSSDVAESSEGDSEDEGSSKEQLRRSKRKKQKAEAEFLTSSGRRVKRRNLDECDGTVSRPKRTRCLRNGKSAKKGSSSKSARPRRRAAKNALNLFSQIGGSSDGEDEEEELGSDSLETESQPLDSNGPSNESGKSIQTRKQKHVAEEEASQDEFTVNVTKAAKALDAEPDPQNHAGNRRLVLKLPLRDPKKAVLRNSVSQAHDNHIGSSSGNTQEIKNLKLVSSNYQESKAKHVTNNGISPQNHDDSNDRECDASDGSEDHPNVSVGYKENDIRWGEVKTRSSKRLRLGEASVIDTWAPTIGRTEEHHVNIENNANGHSRSVAADVGLSDEDQIPGTSGRDSYNNENIEKRGTSLITCNGKKPELVWRINKKYLGRPDDLGHRGPLESLGTHDSETGDASEAHNDYINSTDHCAELDEKKPIAIGKIKFRSRRRSRDPPSSSFKQKSIAILEDWQGSDGDVPFESPIERDDVHFSREMMTSAHEEFSNGSGNSDDQNDRTLRIAHSRDQTRSYSEANNRMYNTVYKRSKSFRTKTDSDYDNLGMEENTSTADNNYSVDLKDVSSVLTDGVRRTRSMGMRGSGNMSSGVDPMMNDFKKRMGHSNAESSRSAERSNLETHEQLGWKSVSKVTVGTRSARSKREIFSESDSRFVDKKKTQHSVRKLSWLMISEPEEGYRYIPQQGDEVAYLRQGHQEFLELSHLHEAGPWKSIKGIGSVEFCRIENLDYSTLPGSGESCCKLTLEFIDSTSIICGKRFKMTLPELTDFPDFLVERARYDAAMKRNWTHRDKCQVWWRSENGEGGSWWEGRVLLLKPKSAEFPDSPWEKCVVLYRGDSSGQHQHSPWELHDPDSPRWEQPCIDPKITKKLLSSFDKIENVSMDKKDPYGVQKLKQISQKSDFLNRFPVPLSFDTVKRRLEKDYYRSLEAVKHDFDVMMSNAESYFAKSAEMGGKLRRLSDWFTRSLLL